jgi:hypothetical protein
MRRACSFCGRTDQKISNEHLWPNWVRKLLPPGRKRIAQQLHRREPHEYYVEHDMGAKINDVCRPCNHGWMNRLEKRVRPFLEPMIAVKQPANLSVEQQLAFWVWAQRFALVADLLRPHDQRFFTPAERDGFRTTLEIANFPTFVWLAAYRPATALAVAVDYIAYNEFEDHSGRRRVHVYCLTIAIGHVAFQVVCVRPSGDRVRPVLRRPGAWGESTLLISPSNTDVVSWPPSVTIDDALMSVFIDRWRST